MLAIAAAGVAARAQSAGSATCLVLPFANRSADADLDWLGESFVVSLQQALAGSGIAVISQQQRQHAMELVGAPAGVELSHATLVRMADAADADWLVAGWYEAGDGTLAIHGWVLDMRREHLVELAPQSGALRQVESLQAQLGWAVREQLAPGGTPAPAGEALPLPAYEEYVRAQMAASPAEQIKALSVAAGLAPKDGRVLLALGQAYAETKDDAAALGWLQQVPPQSPQAQEAEFDAGVAEYRLGQFAQAAAAFQSLAQTLPLPTVVNNLALAQAAASHQPSQRSLETDFREDGFRQLSQVVAQAQAESTRGLAPADRIQRSLEAGQRLQAQGGLEAAVVAFEGVIRQAAASPPELAAAHLGLAQIAFTRHDWAKARLEDAVVLRLDDGNAGALALQKQLEEVPHD